MLSRAGGSLFMFLTDVTMLQTQGDGIRKAKAQVELNLARIRRRAFTGMLARKGRVKKTYTHTHPANK